MTNDEYGAESITNLSELRPVLRLAAVYGQCGRIWESYPSLRPKATNCSDGSSRAAAADEKPLKFEGRSGGCFI